MFGPEVPARKASYVPDVVEPFRRYRYIPPGTPTSLCPRCPEIEPFRIFRKDEFFAVFMNNTDSTLINHKKLRKKLPPAREGRNHCAKCAKKYAIGPFFMCKKIGKIFCKFVCKCANLVPSVTGEHLKFACYFFASSSIGST